ncbi:thioredoxin family protein [Flexithrix dorotheae]|uniref:thioredoxin family protein n=1 Tax=Flexithrix dorotheae TaxID=70993 RepID=UPI00037C5240|nr:thioredoxin family protein [Flexithrix dorotheae]
MEKIIEKSLAKAIPYTAYRDLMIGLSENGKTTGPNQTESLVFYTKLNNQRMKRLDKSLELKPDFNEAIRKINCDLIWLVLTESWCGDAAQILPVLNKIAEASPNIELLTVLRDENLPLMDNFLTNGGRSIPKVIILDKETLEVKGSWGPRPKPAQDMFTVYKLNKKKILYQDFQAELQKWYLKDKAETIQDELLPFLKVCEKK